MDTLKPLSKTEQADRHQEELLDHGLEESFPASDPLSIQVDQADRKTGPDDTPSQDKAEAYRH